MSFNNIDSEDIILNKTKTYFCEERHKERYVLVYVSEHHLYVICTKALPLIGRMRFTVFTVIILHNLNNTYKNNSLFLLLIYVIT